jgi:hypothetical protein
MRYLISIGRGVGISFTKQQSHTITKCHLGRFLFIFKAKFINERIIQAKNFLVGGNGDLVPTAEPTAQTFVIPTHPYIRPLVVVLEII